VRMKANTGVHAGVLFREINRTLAVVKISCGIDNEVNARIKGTLDDIVAIVVELF
jgi:hypothetical protein